MKAVSASFLFLHEMEGVCYCCCRFEGSGANNQRVDWLFWLVWAVEWWVHWVVSLFDG